MKLSVLHTCFVLTAILFSLAAYAQQDTVLLREVDIAVRQTLEEAMLAPLALDSLTISTATGNRLADLLGAHSTLTVKTYGRGSEATVSFRGSAASHTALQWNTIPLNSPMRGYADFSLFPVFFIDDISLAAGGSALAKSGGAIGGLVSLSNKINWNERLHLKYQQVVESFGTYKSYAQIGVGNTKIQSRTRLFHDQSENNFPFYNTGVLPNREDVQKNAAYRQYGILQELSFKWHHTQIVNVQAWYLDHYRDLPQLMSFEGKFRKEYQEDKDRGLRAEWQRFGKRGKWKVSMAYKGHQLHYFRSSTEQQFVHFDANSQEHSFFQNIDYERQISKTTQWHSQLQAAEHKVSINNIRPVKHEMHNRQELSVLQRLNKSFNNRLSAYALLRLDADKGFSTILSPAVGMAYQISEPHKLLCNLSHNYHKPTLNDLYWQPGGNPNLKPEKAYAAELTWQYEHLKPLSYFKARINTFVSLTDDWIVWHPAANGAYYWEADNIKKVLSRGVELYANGKIKFNKTLMAQLSMSYTYTSTTNQNSVTTHDKSRGKQLIYIPKHHANALLNLSWKALYTQFAGQYTGIRYTTSSNNIGPYDMHLEDYFLAQAEVGYKWRYQHWQTLLSLHVHNVFNTNYMSILWRPMPGRYYSFKIQFSFVK